MSSPLPPRPNAEVDVTAADHGAIAPRVVAAGAGAAWWAQGWRTFASRPGMWIGIVIVYLVISVALSKVPYIGGVAHWLLTPVFIGGIMLGCHALDRGEPLRFSHLFDGFTGPHFIPLLTVGAFNILLTVIAAIVAVIVIAGSIGLSGFSNFDRFAADPWEIWRAFGFASFLLIAWALVAVGVIAMVNWFAPAMIVLQDARPVAAMRASFSACLRNWAPFLVYGAIGVGIVLAVICAFVVVVGVIGFGAFMAMFSGEGNWGNWGTMLFGILVILVAYLAITVIMAPVIFGSTYAGYRDTLAAEPA
jgi:hypothetical protein